MNILKILSSQASEVNAQIGILKLRLDEADDSCREEIFVELLNRQILSAQIQREITRTISASLKTFQNKR